MPTKTTKTPASSVKVSASLAPKKSKAQKKPLTHEVKHKKTDEQKIEVKPLEAQEPKAHKAAAPGAERYIFATGRRKTSVANVRLFEGTGKHVINKKPFEVYFGYSFYQDRALKPFDVTGLSKSYRIVAHINGGGAHSQATALSHGLAIALGKTSEEVRKVLKKNGLLTRDDRKKERKKPGLKRARRAPQWAKR
ncbi:MAG: 30S ribosomal protein S9 [Patescibacteria group bacterium]